MLTTKSGKMQTTAVSARRHFSTRAITPVKGKLLLVVAGKLSIKLSSPTPALGVDGYGVSSGLPSFEGPATCLPEVFAGQQPAPPQYPTSCWGQRLWAATLTYGWPMVWWVYQLLWAQGGVVCGAYQLLEDPYMLPLSSIACLQLTAFSSSSFPPMSVLSLWSLLFRQTCTQGPFMTNWLLFLTGREEGPP